MDRIDMPTEQNRLLHVTGASRRFDYALKLDGVGPVDNRPSTDKLHQFVQKKIIMWHVTCDMWHVTHDLFGGWTFSQNFSSLALPVCDLWYYEDLEEKADWVT